ncbi:phasin family protein [Dyella koreensis]|uniref:Phasin family protein n=1 Tax=Dyella koreensis TaxID=311235 RepID=A0ABW8K9C7_9GAMM
MPKSTPNVSAGNVQAMSDMARQSLTAMSGAFSAWMHDASKVQAETVRFLNERFEKDMALLTQFAQCKRPDEIAALQAKLLTSLVTDYMEESRTMLTLLGNVSKHNLEQVEKMAHTATPH